MMCRISALAVLCCLVADLASASLPDRPRAGSGNNFYVLAGADVLDYRLDPRGAPGFTEAGLDIEQSPAHAFIGVGWVFAYPVRLDLVAGGGPADVARPGVDCGVGRVTADLHLAMLETSHLSLEGTLTMGLHAIVYSGLPEEEALPGGEVGLGATLRLDLPGPLGLMTTYRWQQARFQRANIELDDDTVLRVHPTAAFHSVRVLLTWDL